MSEPLLTYRGAIYPWHCDHMGHMNVIWYVGKFDEATWNLFAAAGATAAYLREHKLGMAAVQQNITYKRELHAGAKWRTLRSPQKKEDRNAELETGVNFRVVRSERVFPDYGTPLRWHCFGDRRRGHIGL